MSKNMFTNAIITTNRVLTNPITISYGHNDLDLITTSFMSTFNVIEYLYTANMANKNYEMIPNNYNQYVQLYMVLQKIQYKTKNKNLLLLLKIIQDALVGSINTYTLYGETIMLKLDKTNLEKKVDEILSNKNVKFVEMSNTSGQMTITKSIKLAAVFNYYITIYGMPAYGVGFDPTKIAYLVDILKTRGINPYK